MSRGHGRNNDMPIELAVVVLIGAFVAFLVCATVDFVKKVTA